MSLRELADLFLSIPGLLVWLAVFYAYNKLAHQRPWLAHENFHFGVPITAATCAVLWYELQSRLTAAFEPSTFLFEELLRIIPLAIAIICFGMFFFSVWGPYYGDMIPDGSRSPN